MNMLFGRTGPPSCASTCAGKTWLFPIKTWGKAFCTSMSSDAKAINDKADLRLPSSARCSCSKQWRFASPAGSCTYPRLAGSHIFMHVSSMFTCTKRFSTGRKAPRKFAHCQHANACEQSTTHILSTVIGCLGRGHLSF